LVSVDRGVFASGPQDKDLETLNAHRSLANWFGSSLRDLRKAGQYACSHATGDATLESRDLCQSRGLTATEDRLRIVVYDRGNGGIGQGTDRLPAQVGSSAAGGSVG
jgi:hypothetical protein